MKPMKSALIVAGAVTLAGPTAFAAEPIQPQMGPWPGWHAHSPGFWWICPLIMLFIFAFFALVFFGTRRDRGYWHAPWRWMNEQAESWQPHKEFPDTVSESALDILDKRYARGEIDKQEYEEKKATISLSGT